MADSSLLFAYKNIGSRKLKIIRLGAGVLITCLVLELLYTVTYEDRFLSIIQPSKKHKFQFENITQISLGSIPARDSNNPPMRAQDLSQPTTPPTLRTTTPRSTGIESPIDKEKALLAGATLNQKRFLAIGIPTIRRDKNNSYLLNTVNSLVECMNYADKSEVVIVIFLADFDAVLRNKTLATLKEHFQGYMDMGLIRVIHAPHSFYPSFKGLKRTYGHPEHKVIWRSKQNYDYAFLLKYSINISYYYMQLEDDVVTVKNYVQIIKDYIAAQKGHWVCLELSELGYIGKLYHTYDLDQLAKMLMLFFQEQPPDLTFIYFNILLLQNQRIIRIPTIFQHMGFHSSLRGKIQRLKDTKFVDTTKYLAGDNPPASIYTNFTTYEPYKPNFAYAKYYGYFWAKKPKVFSYYLLVFDRPEKITRIAVTTGSNAHAKDILQNGIVEISPTLLSKSNTHAECANYIKAADFNKTGFVDITNIKEICMFDVFCIRITMTAHQLEWIIFREIAVFVMPR